MKKINLLFIYLTLLLIILELAFAGLYFTKSTAYLIVIIIATTGISLIGHALFTWKSMKTAIVPQNEYHFYYLDHNAYEQEFFKQIGHRF